MASLPSASSSATIAKLLEHIQAATGPRQIEVKLPSVDTAPILVEWTHPAGTLRRHSCPIESSSVLDVESFSKYLRDMCCKDVTVDLLILNIKRFFNLLIVEEGEYESVGVLCTIYQTNLLPKIMDAPLMDIKYTWARNIISALDHFCEYLQVYCNRRRWEESKATLKQLADEVLYGYKRRSFDYRSGIS